MKFKGAIFDLDGTLLDSMPYWDNLGTEYLKHKGYQAPENINQILKTMSLAQAAQYLQENYLISQSQDEIQAEILQLIEDQYLLTIPLKASVKPFLQSLYEHQVKMGIATATSSKLAKAALERLGVANYFEFILTCTDAGLGKDRPEFFLKALKLLKTPKEETIVFEDALHAIKSAKAAGFFVAAVYDQSSREDWEEIKKLADLSLNSFADWKMVL